MTKTGPPSSLPPAQLTGKDIDITTIAILKSVIESGADPKLWDTLVKAGWKVYLATTRGIKDSSIKPSKPVVAPAKGGADDMLGSG